jgi:hypothetical protein
MAGSLIRLGSLDIAKVGTDPEIYAVTFSSPSDAPGSDQTGRTFTSLGEVDEFLQQAGIAAERYRPALSEAGQQGTASIPDVSFENSDLHQLGLRAASGAAAHSD